MKLAKNLEEKKIHTVDWSITSRAKWSINISSIHLKIQLTKRLNMKDSDRKIKNRICRRMCWEEILCIQRVVHLQKQLDEAPKQCL